VNSDRGRQFRSGNFVRLLRSNGLIGSVGRVGACADNAAIESFFTLLHRSVLDVGDGAPGRAAIGDLIWIERTSSAGAVSERSASSPRSSLRPYTRSLHAVRSPSTSRVDRCWGSPLGFAEPLPPGASKELVSSQQRDRDGLASATGPIRDPSALATLNCCSARSVNAADLGLWVVPLWGSA
jgi:hypothetical protein